VARKRYPATSPSAITVLWKRVACCLFKSSPCIQPYYGVDGVEGRGTSTPANAPTAVDPRAITDSGIGDMPCAVSQSAPEIVTTAIVPKVKVMIT